MRIATRAQAALASERGINLQLEQDMSMAVSSSHWLCRICQWCHPRFTQNLLRPDGPGRVARTRPGTKVLVRAVQLTGPRPRCGRGFYFCF